MPKRILEGVVTSNAANKTITVQVERRVRHPLYNKIVRQSNKFAAHDENNIANVGDKVQIIESRPLSKSKRWMLIESEQMLAEHAAKPKSVVETAAPKAAAAKPAAKKTAKK